MTGQPTEVETGCVFLSEIDEVSDTEKEKALAVKLVAAGWKKPRAIVGADPGELVQSLDGLSMLDRAFIRRALKQAERADAAPVAATQDPATQSLAVPATQLASSQPELLQTLQSLMGAEGSALRVAEALSKGDTKVDVTAVMKKGGLEEIKDSFCPGVEVYTALHLDTAAAKKDSKKAFTYVDLTHSSMLPDFLPPEAVGGKTVMLGNEEVLSGYTGSIAQLGAAIKALTTAPRMFRNMS